MSDTFTPPTHADAQAAQARLDPPAFEAALCAAGDYLNGRRLERGKQQMTGTEIGVLMGAIALAVQAYQEAAGPESRDERIAELEARLAGSVTIHPDYRAGHACIGASRVPARIIAGLVPDVGEDGVADFYPNVTPAGARAAVRFGELYRERDEDEATKWDARLADTERGRDYWKQRHAEVEEQFNVVRSVVATWEHRTRHGDSATAPLLRDLQDALAAHPAAPGPAQEDPAATWPSRAARRLEDDAHPTERSGR
ncbi:hypothetical protein [Nocardiopsis sp. FR26]|uniref:DUF433 domain-containing protein n=1 Tax=Nocardiopsis sp. FR26 TaxID=2605987 RepID=UPI00135BB3BA|nr:hypothetical protein [Nocardiopsis sp. FR26]